MTKNKTVAEVMTEQIHALAKYNEKIMEKTGLNIDTEAISQNVKSMCALNDELLKLNRYVVKVKGLA